MFRPYDIVLCIEDTVEIKKGCRYTVLAVIHSGIVYEGPITDYLMVQPCPFSYPKGDEHYFAPMSYFEKVD